MSRFYVGQRVRVNSPGNEMHGKESTIRRLNVRGCDFGDVYLGAELNERMGDGSDFPFFIYEYHELEPITDSYDVTSWDTCVWKPEHLRAGA